VRARRAASPAEGCGHVLRLLVLDAALFTACRPRGSAAQVAEWHGREERARARAACA